MGNWISVPSARGQRHHFNAKASSRLARSVSWALRAAAPVLLAGAFVRCSAGEATTEDLRSLEEPAAPGLEGNSELGGNSDTSLEEGDGESGDLGQLTQALVVGARCTPDQSACNGNKSQVCLRGVVVEQDCESGRCVDGTCRACLPGNSCVGNSLQTCAADGSRVLGTAQCAFGCSAGRCRLCTAGSASCNGQTLTACSADGTTQTTSQCPTGTTCNAAQGACVGQTFGTVCFQEGVPVACPGQTLGAVCVQSDGILVPCPSPGLGRVCVQDGAVVPCR